MRELEINKQTIYYAAYLSNVNAVNGSGQKTGEKQKTYSTPVAFRINVSSARGNADRDIFGINCNYTHTMSTADLDCPITETSVLWVGITPGENNTTPPNFVVVRKAKSLHDIVYAIREVTLSV